MLDQNVGRKFSPEELNECFRVHFQPEIDNDLEGTLATLAPNPWYELYPLNLRIDGEDALRAYYQRFLGEVLPRTIKSTQRSIAFGDSHLVVEHFSETRMPDDTLANRYSLTLMAFNSDGKLQGERLYMCANGYKLSQFVFGGEDFTSLPGVTRMT